MSTSSEIKLQLPAEKGGPARISIFNKRGELVHNESCYTAQGLFDHTVDVALLRPGRYLLEVMLAGSRMTSELLVKR